MQSVLVEFVASVRRRMVLLGLIEKLGVALLFAGASASVAMSFLLWYNQSTIACGEGFILAGVVAGIVWGAVRKATPLQAAMETDRQLGLSELLSTAWFLGRGRDFKKGSWQTGLAEFFGKTRLLQPPAHPPSTLGEGWGEGDFERRKSFDDHNYPHPNPLPAYWEREQEGFPKIETRPWQTAIYCQAASHCNRNALSSLKLRKLSGRMWGAVALATTLVMTLALLSPTRRKSLADQDRSTQSEELPAKDMGKNAQPDQFASTENRPILLPDPDDLASSTIGQNQEARKPESNPSQSNPADADPHETVAASENSRGGGSSETHAPGDAALPSTSDNHADAHKPRSDNLTSPAGNGTGASTGNVSGDATAGAGAGTSALTPAPQPPPWTSADWPAKLEQARSALTAGTVPAAYRDLVRGYFSE